MKKEHFEKLVTSIKEAGEIKAGRKAPSRMYEIKPPDIKAVREKLNDVGFVTNRTKSFGLMSGIWLKAHRFPGRVFWG